MNTVAVEFFSGVSNVVHSLSKSSFLSNILISTFRFASGESESRNMITLSLTMSPYETELLDRKDCSIFLSLLTSTK